MAPEIRLSAVTRRRVATNSPRPEELSVFVREARLRFMEAFEAHCGTLAPADLQAPPPSLDEAGRLLHRIAGLGGALGFPLVSAKAAEIEEWLFDGNRRQPDLRAAIAELRQAFSQDATTRHVPEPPLAPDVRLTILLVEDEPVQRKVLAGLLSRAGHRPIVVAAGEDIVPAARAHRPDVILLDVELPGIDGYRVCRMLKDDPELAAIPVAFLSARNDVQSRLAGLSHGADDFLAKPIDARELMARLDRLGKRRRANRLESASMGDMTPAVAPPAVEPALPGTMPCVMVVDDDREMVRLVDIHLGAVGYRRLLAYDGAEALEQVKAQRPDLVVLDLRMPQLDGFEVLARLKDVAEPRPRVLVLSAHGRQEDVVRAFQLGAHDFVVKPFNPQDLLERVARLAAPADRRCA